jgi:hypothetical protein
MSTRTIPRESTAIQASWGPRTCLPPATTAASIRSRLWPASPLTEKTVSGIGHNCSVMAARVTLKAVNDELARRGHHARVEKASGYFYFWSEDSADWIDRTVRVATLNALTLEQWVAEYLRLKKVNGELMRQATGAERVARKHKGS